MLWRLILAAALSATAAQCNSMPFAFVTNQEGDTVAVLDVANRSTVTTVAVDTDSAGVAIGNKQRFVCVTNPKSKNVSVLDTQLLPVRATIPAGEGALRIVADPIRDRIYVAA